MHVYFATNRDVRRETSSGAVFGDRFHRDGPQFFRVGRCTVGPKPGNGPTDDDAFDVTEVNLYPERRGRGPRRPQSGRLFDELRKQLRDERRDVLVFLHGYSSTFENAIQRAAALQVLYNHGKPDEPDPVVFTFTWPSNGRSFPYTDYFSDRHDAEMSGLAMARALEALLRFMAEALHADEKTVVAARDAGMVPDVATLQRCGARLHVLAHSMGNYALRHAVLGIARALGVRPLPRLFKNAFLMAADEDADALADPTKLGLLFELAQNVHVYHSTDDVALQISTRTKSNPERLGSDGPTSLTDLAARCYVVDCSEVDRTIVEHGNHQYYRIRREVIDDVKEVLRGTPLERIPHRQLVVPGRAWRLPAR